MKRNADLEADTETTALVPVPEEPASTGAAAATPLAAPTPSRGELPVPALIARDGVSSRIA